MRGSNRALAAAVVVAVVAGATVAGIGLATRGSRGAQPALVVDERAGRIGPIVLGETRADVVAVLGPPRSAGAARLVYAHVSVDLRGGRVVAIGTDDPTARTLRAVGTGDALGAIRAAYRKAATCRKLPEKETEGGTGSAASSCTVDVPAGRLVALGDPIESFRLSRRSPPR